MVGLCVLFYINEQLESHPLKHLSDSNYESLWIKVYLSKTKPIFLSVVYRPPSNGSDLDSTLPRSNKVFICGDLNCKMLNKY